MLERSRPADAGKRRPGLRAAFAALHHPQFRLYFISGLGLTAAQGIEQLVLAWLVLDLTDSVGQLGFMIFVRGVPMAVLSLFGGVLADRYDRRSLLMYTQGSTMTVMAVLAGLTVGGVVEVWHVYVAATALGLLQSLTMPARQAMLRALVSDDDLMNAVALSTVQMNSARVLWPSVAGGLIAWQGIGVTLIVCSLCYVIAIGFLALLDRVEEQGLRRGGSAVKEIAEAFRYVAATPLIATVAIMMTGIAMFGLAFMFLAPAFAREVLGFDAGITGVFLMASGVGSIIGSSVLLAAQVRNRTALFVRLAAAFALCLLALSLNPWTAVAFLIMVCFGVTNAGLIIMGQTIFQATVPDRLLGRVMSLWSLTGGLGAITALPLGVIGELFGLRWALGGIAVILLLLTLVVGIVRAPWRLEAEPEAEAAAAAN